MKALILAAGYATRLYPLNQLLPKALLPLGEGKTLLDRMIDKINDIPAGAGASDCDEIIVVSNHKFIDQFRAWRAGYRGRIPLDLLDDGTEEVTGSLGAIGDICHVIDRKGIDEDMLILAGDTYFDFSPGNFLTLCRERGHDGVCVKHVADRRQLSQMGVVLLDDGDNIVNIEEKPAEPRSDLAMYAIYYYTGETVRLFSRYKKEGNPMDAPGNFIVWLYTRKAITTYAIEGECYDVGTVEAYTKLLSSLGLEPGGCVPAYFGAGDSEARKEK